VKERASSPKKKLWRRSMTADPNKKKTAVPDRRCRDRAVTMRRSAPPRERKPLFWPSNSWSRLDPPSLRAARQMLNPRIRCRRSTIWCSAFPPRLASCSTGFSGRNSSRLNAFRSPHLRPDLPRKRADSWHRTCFFCPSLTAPPRSRVAVGGPRNPNSNHTQHER